LEAELLKRESVWFTCGRYFGICFLLVGCDPSSRLPPAKDSSAGTVVHQSVTLRIWVVNAPELGRALGRLRGEWKEISGSSFVVEGRTPASLREIEQPDADLILFSVNELGKFCESGWLRPVRKSVLTSDLYDAQDVFPIIRNQVIRYGGQTMALPVAVQLPLICYRKDLFQSAPQTWSEFARASTTLAQHDLSVVEPVASWGACLLLARVAPLATHPSQEAWLFDLETMKPRLTEPPFLRALEMVTAGMTASEDSPTAATWSVLTGRAGMAFGLPQTVRKGDEKVSPEVDESRVGWAEIPGSQEVYSPTLAQWETVDGDVRRVPLVTGGLVAGVTTTSRNAAGAFRLLAWLASREISDQLAAAVDGMLPVRGSQWRVGGGDFEVPVGRWAGVEIGAAAGEVFSHPQGLLLPRIPGKEAYLEALQRAVDEVVGQGETPPQALARAARSWEAITDHYGREAQRRSYLRHLNLGE